MSDTLIPYAPPERWVRLDGALNFRDLGGYLTASGARVRWGRLFRSDALDDLSARDQVRLRDELHLRSIVDLRCVEEQASRGLAPIALLDRPMLELPSIDPAFFPGVGLHDIYLDILRTHRDRVAAIIATICELESPLVFHCGAGKDRSGLIAAALLGALGVSDDDVARDYALSARVLPAIVEAQRQRLVRDTQPAPSMPPEVHTAGAETMRKVLRALRAAHGSMLGYVLDSGVAPDAVATFRDRGLD